MSETRVLSAIVLGARARRDMGDIKALTDSIARHGLLHPVVVMRDGTLVAGARRIEAVKLLGWDEVPVTVVDVDDLLSAERDENTVRKDFTPTEAVAIGRLIEERHRPEAVEAKRVNMARTQAIKAGAVPGETPTTMKVGDTRDKAARAVGMSSFTYQRAKNVVEAAESDPARYGDLPTKMDASGQVLPAYRELDRRGGARRRKEKAPARHPILAKTHHPKPDLEMQRAIAALGGICMGLEALEIDKLDSTHTAVWAEALKNSAATISRIARRVADVKAA